MFRSFVLLLTAATVLPAQNGGPSALRFSGEFALRYEDRIGINFQPGADRNYLLLRSRLAAEWRAAPWLTFSAMAQDARVPLYGEDAPAPLRDTLDLQEAYADFFAGRERGFSARVGRHMARYGESRLIGAPQWLNVARTYDAVSLRYRTPGVQWEILHLSVVPVLPTVFNRPNLNDRIWGTYNVFENWIRGGEVEIYVLRHDQNRRGGFALPGGRHVNLFGTRVVSPLPSGLRLEIETVGQTGSEGGKPHRAHAWFSGLSRRIPGRVPVDLASEYKYASGTDDPGGARSGTFDQLYPANHDKFGRADLFGWRNIHNLRGQVNVHPARGLVLTVMYNNSWLASPRDALYAGPGRPITRAPLGDAGRHLGHEADFYASFKRGRLQLGAGVAKLFAGEYLRRTIPGANNRFFYVLQTLSF
ncbi:MAG: alginate export family protein [Bryobacterales bacterium]|nr:alginate export family protein [Bryobacterales bacterium]